jgi:hypothetical protein
MARGGATAWRLVEADTGLLVARLITQAAFWLVDAFQRR